MIPIQLISLGASLLGNWQRIVLYAALAAAVLGVTWMHGYGKGSARLHEYRAEQATAAVAIVQKQAAATERVVTRYIEVKGKTQTVTETIEKEVVRYADRNPGQCIDADWRLLHDAAAANIVSPGAGGLHDPGRAPPAAGTGLRSPDRR